MKLFKIIFSLLLIFLGFASETLKAEIQFQEERDVITLYECNFLPESSEIEWLGLLYLQEESSQNQSLFFQLDKKSLPQNFSGEVCLKFQGQESNQLSGSLTIQEKLENTTSNSNNRQRIVEEEKNENVREVDDLASAVDDLIPRSVAFSVSVMRLDI